LVQSTTHKEKINDIAHYFRDAFGNEDDSIVPYREFARDFLKYMAANEWDIVDYDVKYHTYYPKVNGNK